MGFFKNEFIMKLESDPQFLEDHYFDSDLWNCDPDYPDIGNEDNLSSMSICFPLAHSSVLEDVPF